MKPSVAGWVLASAVLHASWNALLKSGGDRLRAIVVMSLAACAASAVWAAFLPVPPVACWGYIGLSVALHIAYNALLVISYRHGDLGVTYPVARGSSPMLVATGALVLAGEHVGGLALLGIGLVCGGIFGLAREHRGVNRWRVLGPAILTGVTIAGYTVVDGLGSRIAGNPGAYAAWLFVAMGPAMCPLWLWRPGRGAGTPLGAGSLRPAMGGLASLVAYAVVIWAESVSPMGPVSALRESSVVVATFIGWLVLGERMSAWRLAACIVVAAGAACLGLRG